MCCYKSWLSSVMLELLLFSLRSQQLHLHRPPNGPTVPPVSGNVSGLRLTPTDQMLQLDAQSTWSGGSATMPRRSGRERRVSFGWGASRRRCCSWNRRTPDSDRVLQSSRNKRSSLSRLLLTQLDMQHDRGVDQSNYSSRIVFSHIPIEFGQTGISAIRSADPENSQLGLS